MVMRKIGKFHGLLFVMKDQRATKFVELHQLSDISPQSDRAIQALKKLEYQNIMYSLENNTLNHFDQ